MRNKFKLSVLTLVFASVCVYGQGVSFIVNNNFNYVKTVDARLSVGGYCAVVLKATNVNDPSKFEVIYSTVRDHGEVYKLKFDKQTAANAAIKVDGYALQGRIDVTPDTDYTYLMPVSMNKKTLISITDSIIYCEQPRVAFKRNYIHFSANKGDTVYACRRGEVTSVHEYKCNNLGKYYSYCIQHNDGTTMSYTPLKPLRKRLQVGDIVMPAQPIGIMGRSENADKSLTLHLSSVLLNPNLGKRAVMYNQVILPQSLVPKFMTTEGAKELQNEQWYNPKTTTEIITKEMTDSEKRKYSKQSKK